MDLPVSGADRRRVTRGLDPLLVRLLRRGGSLPRFGVVGRSLDGPAGPVQLPPDGEYSAGNGVGFSSRLDPLRPPGQAGRVGRIRCLAPVGGIELVWVR